MLTLRVLGQMGASRGQQDIALGGQRTQIVLALLALDVGRVVDRSAIVDALWEDDPPPSAVSQVAIHISSLRKVLGKDVIETVGTGYRLRADGVEVDTHRAEQLIRQGREQQDPDALAEAIGLWQGAVLAGLEGPTLAGAIRRWEELRLDVLEEWAALETTRGGHRSVVSELTVAVSANPLREGLRARLMEALWRLGRQADALRLFREGREVLIEELGLEPGHELRELEQQILVGDAPTVAASPTSGLEVPHQLPFLSSGFVGREGDLAALDGLLLCEYDGDPPLVVLTGTGGVGKTTTAVRWAHGVRDQFPDGLLFVDLRGYSPEDALTVEDVLTGFLLGLAPGHQPRGGADELAGRFRTMVSGRRLLVVLDNATSSEVVRALLPGTPTAAVLVTSRDSLPGLEAREGAKTLDLGVLPPDQARLLLEDRLGDVARAKPEATAAVARHCAGLPLALRVASELARTRGMTDLAALAVELADDRGRLDLLDAAGDPRAAVRSVFRMSYQALSPSAARLFRLTVLHPGWGADAFALAALDGDPVRTTRLRVDELVRAHLIEPSPGGRYRSHDLLRSYAAELVHHEDTEAERETAFDRLLHYTLAATAEATRQAHLRDQRLHAGIGECASDLPVFTGREQASAWLDEETPNLVAIAEAADGRGHYPEPLTLAILLRRILQYSRHRARSSDLHRRAVRAAQRAGDRDGEAVATMMLGLAEFQGARYGRARQHLERALQMHDPSDAPGRARILNGLAGCLFIEGRLTESHQHLVAATEIYRARNWHNIPTTSLTNLGLITLLLDRPRAARTHAADAVRIATSQDDQYSLAHGLIVLSQIDAALGHHQIAIDRLNQTLALTRQQGFRWLEGEALHELGTAHLLDLDPAQCITHEQAALVVAREIADTRLTSAAKNMIGAAHLGAGRPAEGLDAFRSALVDADAGGIGHQRARALTGLGDALAALDRPAEASECCHRALEAYQAMDVPADEDVVRRLARLVQREL